MNSYYSVFSQVLILYIIMLIGAVIYRLKILNDEIVSGITKLMLNVTIPATILNGLKGSVELNKSDILDMLLLSVSSYLFVIIISYIILRVFFVKKEERPFYQYISIFGNVGFIGYPMITVIIGTHSVLLGAINNLFYGTLLYSLGIFLMSRYNEGETHAKHDWKHMLNMGLFAAFMVVVLFLLDIELPPLLSQTASLLGGLTSPLAMIVVGASINHINLKKIINNYRIILISIIKMVGYPIGFAYLLKLIGFTGTPAMVAVVLIGMPIATTTVIMAMEYNKKNLVKAAEATVFSTLLLIFTIPVLVFAVSVVT